MDFDIIKVRTILIKLLAEQEGVDVDFTIREKKSAGAVTPEPATATLKEKAG